MTSSARGAATGRTTRRCGTWTVSSTRSSRSARPWGSGRTNFVLYGHSWGGILTIEYALHHQEHLRAIVISNMMSSVPAYNAYAEQVLMPAMDAAALAEIKALEASGDIENPRYMELLNEQHYVHHVLRMPIEDWPDPAVRAFAHINPAIYVSMQGPERARHQRGRQPRPLGPQRRPGLDRRAGAGDRRAARHDGPGPHGDDGGAPAEGRYLYCPDGSHMAMYDDQVAYFAGLIDFLHGLDGN